MCCTFNLPVIYSFLYLSICLFSPVIMRPSIQPSLSSPLHQVYPPTPKSCQVSLHFSSSPPHLLFLPGPSILKLYAISIYMRMLRLPDWMAEWLNSTWILPTAQSYFLVTGQVFCDSSRNGKHGGGWERMRQTLPSDPLPRPLLDFTSHYLQWVFAHNWVIRTSKESNTQLQQAHTPTQTHSISQLPKSRGEIGLWKWA